MTTASIYYSRHTEFPQYVLINGESATILDADYEGGPWPNLVGAKVRAIDHACRRLGWKVVDTATIVRQADGRATIRIEPLTAATELRDTATAYITVNLVGVPEAVSVDGKTEPVHTACTLLSVMAGNVEVARRATRNALAVLGYEAIGDPAMDGDGRWAVQVRPDDWRDHPTMVRISDDAARALNEVAALLNTPGDTLATAWILRAAMDAKGRHARWTEEGFIEDPTRITGWAADGTPHLKD